MPDCSSPDTSSGNETPWVPCVLEIADSWDAQHILRASLKRSLDMLTTQIEMPLEKLVQFCRRWKIARLEVFGSGLRKDFRPDSDVDFLATFAPNVQWGFSQWLTMEEELAGIVGHNVDLIRRSVIEQSENWYRREQILTSAQSIYES